jgi:hypothetical protein
MANEIIGFGGLDLFFLVNLNELFDALRTPWGAQMWVPNWKQRKSKESGHDPWLTTL